MEIDADKLPPFPKRLAENLKAIRVRFRLTPDQIAKKVGAKTGAESLGYEHDNHDLPVTVLIAYTKLAGIPVENIIRDDCDLWLGHRVN